MFVVTVGEEAAALKRNAHGLLIGRGHEVEEREGHVVLVRGRRLALVPERHLRVAGHGKRTADHGHGLDTGDACELALGLAIPGAQLFRRDLGIRGHRSGEGEHMARVEARIDAPECGQTSDHESGPDEQDQGHRHFQDDEHALRAMVGAARAAPSFPQGFAKLRPQHPDRGGEPEHDPGEDGNARGEEQHPGIDRDLVRAGQGVREALEDRDHRQFREDEAKGSTRHSQKDALREQLPDDTSGSGPEGQADGELAGAPGRPREQQVAHIRARDQQNERHRAEEHEQGSARLADHVRLQGNHGDPAALVGVGIGGGEVSRDRVHVGLGLRRGDAPLQPPHRVRAHADVPIAERRVRPLADGDVDVGRTESRNAALSHADDRVGLAVERDALLQNLGRRGELPLPQAVAENRHGTGADPVFVLPETAPDQRVDPIGREEVRGNHVRVEPLGLARAGQVVVVGPEGRQKGEGMVLPCQSSKFG